MSNPSAIAREKNISRELINQHLAKIFSTPVFLNSDILRKFLAFIVDQTLSDHSDWLKEYTIGVNVLNKSLDFKPKENGIVRIHAGRLRRALHHYYNNTGVLDCIQISIPKGRYVPVFIEKDSQAVKNIPAGSGKSLNDPPSPILENQPKVIAVLPFKRSNDDVLENSLADSVGLQLSDALMQYGTYSVMAYYAMRDLWQKAGNITKLSSNAKINYIISGSIQTAENRVRSHIQMIDLHSGIQLWNCMYEGEMTSKNIFTLQDEIVQFIISELKKSRKLINDKTHHVSIAAVA